MARDAAARNAAIDRMLAQAAEAGDVPGVVAMATDRHGPIYEGAFGQRVLGEPAARRLLGLAQSCETLPDIRELVRATVPAATKPGARASATPTAR